MKLFIIVLLSAVEILAGIKFTPDLTLYFLLWTVISGLVYCFSVPFTDISDGGAGRRAGMTDVYFQEFKNEQDKPQMSTLEILKSPPTIFFAINLMAFIYMIIF